MIESNFKISIVIPCFNEEGNILLLYQELCKWTTEYKNREFIFVDDGSLDKTLELIKILAEADNKVKYISFSRNFGHENAVKAGIDYAIGDCIINMDGDLQHPPQLIPELINKWLEGYDVVYTVRTEDKNMSLKNRIGSRVYYKIFNRLSDI